MIMLNRMRELCEQVWSSQLVANQHESGRDSIAYMLRGDGRYGRIVDWTQVWDYTPQGSDYWNAIDREWRNNH